MVPRTLPAPELGPLRAGPRPRAVEPQMTQHQTGRHRGDEQHAGRGAGGEPLPSVNAPRSR